MEVEAEAVPPYPDSLRFIEGGAAPQRTSTPDDLFVEDTRAPGSVIWWQLALWVREFTLQ